VLLAESTGGAVLAYPSTLSFGATWPLEVPAGDGGPSYQCACEGDVAQAVVIFLAFAGELFNDIDGVGPILVALALDGFQGSVSASSTHKRPGIKVTDLPVANNVMEASTATLSELRDQPEAAARRLIARWLVPFYRGAEIYRRIFTDAE